MTVLGIDISKWQPQTPSLDGLGFCFVKASEGTAQDPKYDYHAANVRKAGIVLGAYAFGVDGISGAAQAHTLLEVAGRADLFALDVEGAHAPSEKQARDFGATMHGAGKLWGLYASASGYPRWGQDWLWVAQWGAQSPTLPWMFWQRRGSPLDLDTFRGSLLDLHRLARIAAPPRYRLAVKGRTSVYDHPNGTRVGGITSGTYTASRAMAGGKWWYRVLGPRTSGIIGRYLPAEPWMEGTQI